jgi:predicted 3-demethylubiquinone-9 3-methyltransferase (glyoxalase superfamily)
MYDSRPDRTNEVVPSLMFIQNNNGKTQEAIDYYTSLFDNSNIDFVRKYAAGENDIE